jgi:putative transport protein
MDIGIVLFVYAIGIQVGPQFFNLFRKNGWKLASVGLAMTSIGFLVTLAVAYIFKLPNGLAAGIFSGSLMNTPSLAAAVDMIGKYNIGDPTQVTAGYGIVYPFAVIFTVLFVQFLPRILKRDPMKEEKKHIEKEKSEHPALLVKQFTVENPACVGKRVEDIHQHDLAAINISRIRRNKKDHAAHAGFCFAKGDVVTAVGKEEDLAKLALIFGRETSAPIKNTNVVSVDIEITAPSMMHKSIASLDIWHQYGIVVVRLIRQDFEIVPRGNMTFEAGDVVRVVGEREEVDAFAKAAGVKNEKANETNFLPFILGLIFGLVLGLIPVSLPVLHGAPITLGSAGGALLAGLIISRQKRIGKMEMHVPIAALNIIRELGLMFFLSGAGLVAGSQFVGVFQEYGISVLFAGALITAITCFSGAVMLVLLRLDILSIMAGVSAGMTQASALAVTRKLAKTELPTLAYVNIYPFAMILKIIFVQVLVSILAIFY